MAARRELWFLQPFRFPSDHAHSIQILNTCRSIAEEGTSVRLMVQRNPERPVADVDEGLRCYGLLPHEGLRIDWLPTTHKGITGAAARFRIWRAKGPPVFYARHFRLAAWSARRGPTIVELHRLDPASERAVARARGIVTIATPLRDAVQKVFQPRSPIEVIPDAADLSKFPPVQRDGPLRLVYTGHFHEWKGVDVLIRALALLPEVSALVVGGRSDGRGEELRRLAEREGVSGRIRWIGFVPQSEIAGHLTRGDIGIVPTRAQNGQDIAASPLKLFEFMAVGVPVVVSDLPSLRDIVRDGENGILFREGDPASLAEGIRRADSDRNRLVSRATEEAHRHTWRERARRILGFLDRLGL